ncbi:MAG: tetratricopeptide repeat protein, partial [Gemmatimonadetes bacterium]|nr:tetratricopeptide repeat protein [Gemmatimonadota bacterium]
PAPAVLTGANVVAPTTPVSGGSDAVSSRRRARRARLLTTAAVAAVVGVALASVATVARRGPPDASPPAPSPTARVEAELGRDAASPSLPDEVRLFVLKAQHLARTHGDPALGVALLDSALVRAPELAPALGLKAELLLRLDDPANARSAALAGLRLDPSDPGALRALAGVQMLDGTWTEAEASLTGALSAHPDDPTTLTALAFLLTVQGRFDEAQEALAHAERGDPLTPLLLADAGLLHLWAGRFDRAAAACRETLQLDPRAVWALGCAFDALVRAQRHAEAAEVGRTLLATYGAEDVPEPSADPATVLARVRQWRVAAWEDAVRDGDPPFYLAVAYADAGRTVEALRALEEAARQPSLAVLSAAVEPRLRALADEVAFRSVLRRLKLSGSPARS